MLFLFQVYVDNVLYGSTNEFVERQESVTATNTNLYFGTSTTTTATTVTSQERIISIEEFTIMSKSRQTLESLNVLRPGELVF